MIYTLYVDAFDGPMYGPSVSKNSHDNLMKGYADNLGSTWPFFADPEWVLGPYFDKAALPLAMLVTTEDMKIIYAKVGHHSDMLKTTVNEVFGL